MMSNYKRTLITSALPYANGPVHIGHLAGVYVPADIYARYLRLKGEDVLFIGGSDEHGVPITLKAKKEGLTPQDIVDRYHNIIKKSFSDFGISFDVYSRTSADIHTETASQFFRKLYDDSKFIEKTSEQFYDEEAQQFLADRYITGTCPKCSHDKAYGDQCESCGTSLNATDLINPKSVLTGNNPILKETKHWYLPLDKYEEWLKQWILEEHQEWKPNVYGQCKSWIDSGLQPRAVTRDLDWGVPVPVDGADNKVLYVWFDAPIGYISATRECTSDWEKWWKDEDTRMLHFIGKDNIVFHCIIFPSMLKAHGEYILPENVPANEFLNLEGDKISTSRNWAVWLHEYLEDFPDKEDVLKYVLTANAPETKDNDFTWKDFQARNNNELVAILGNFVNRTLVLTDKYYGGNIPALGELTDADRAALTELGEFKNQIDQSFSQFRFREALKYAMDIARLGNKYLADAEPWKLIKTEEQRVKTIMNICLQITANLTIAFEPFMPKKMQELRMMLNMQNLSWNDLGRKDLLAVGDKINKPSLLFDKIEDEQIELQINKLQNTKEQNEETKDFDYPVIKDTVSFEDFMKMDIRVGKILECEKVPKTDKLLKFLIDIGCEKRTVVSGIAEHYKAEDLIGKEVCMIINLAPRKIKGIESCGMILSALDKDASLKVIRPQTDVMPGSTVG
ncbi:MAG: methionine--tRNA ligase [Bacteroidales bacterium]